MIPARRRQLATVLVVSGFAIVPLTVSAELALGWLSPHGDGLPTLLLSVVLMLALCATGYQLLRRELATVDPTKRRTRVARAVALSGVIIPLVLLAVFAFLATAPTP